MILEKQIQEILIKGDITWQSLLMDLVKQEGMDPWDVDVSKLANSYIQTVRKLKEANLGVSGKFVLASALLLKVKSKRLIGEDLDNLDALFRRTEEEAILAGDFEDINLLQPLFEGGEEPRLNPRTPQPRKRKVSVFDLVEALEKAMNTRKRRIERTLPGLRHKITLPESTDISEIIVSVYRDIKDYFKSGKNKLTFKELARAEDRETRMFTFIPLLHLHNERRIDLNQEAHLGEIGINLVRKNARSNP